jgi:cysteinyl-tRNA synthetase
LEEELGGWASEGKESLVALTEKVSSIRTQAQASKDFSQLDAFKAALTAAGVEVRMSKAGVELIPTASFDPAKLDALL